MVELMNKYQFEPQWIEAFLDAMEADLHKKTYHTIDELLAYIYGSAEVVGLMMAQIMNLPESSWEAAKAQRKAMQLINFIRDIAEDNQLGRVSTNK